MWTAICFCTRKPAVSASPCLYLVIKVWCAFVFHRYVNELEFEYGDDCGCSNTRRGRCGQFAGRRGRQYCTGKRKVWICMNERQCSQAMQWHACNQSHSQMATNMTWIDRQAYRARGNRGKWTGPYLENFSNGFSIWLFLLTRVLSLVIVNNWNCTGRRAPTILSIGLWIEYGCDGVNWSQLPRICRWECQQFEFKFVVIETSIHLYVSTVQGPPYVFGIHTQWRIQGGHRGPWPQTMDKKIFTLSLPITDRLYDEWNSPKLLESVL